MVKTPWREICSLSLILVSALILALPGMGKGLWLDELTTVEIVSRDTLGNMLGFLRHDLHPPLYFVLLRPWAALSTAEPFLRLFSLILNLATLSLIWIWIRRGTSSGGAAIIAGTLAAFLPVFIRFGQEIRPYSLLLFATAFTFFAASRSAVCPRKFSRTAATAFGLLTATATSMTGILLAAPVAVVLLFPQREAWKSALVRVAAVILPSAVLFLFTYFIYMDRAGYLDPGGWWIPPLSGRLVWNSAAYLAGIDTRSLPEPLTTLRIAAFLLLAIALIAGNWRRGAPLLAAAVLFWLEIAVYSAIRPTIYWYRTLLPGVIPLIAFAGMQLAPSRSGRRRIVQPIALVAVGLLSLTGVLQWRHEGAFRPVEAYRDAAHTMMEERLPNETVVLYPGYIRSIVQLYAPFLESDSIIPAPVDGDVNEIVDRIAGRLIGTAENRATVTVLVRADTRVRMEYPRLAQIVSALGERARQLDIDLRINLILLTCTDEIIIHELHETRQEILRDFENVFGSPRRLIELDQYVRAEYSP